MQQAEIRKISTQALDCYEAHILAGLTAARATNPMQAIVHHQLSWKHFKIAFDLMQNVFGGQFTGTFDLVLEPPTTPFYPPSPEIKNAFDLMREEYEIALSIGFNKNPNEKTGWSAEMRQKQSIKLDTLCNFIGRCLEREYEPETDNVTITTTKETMTLDEYATRLAEDIDTPKIPIPSMTNRLKDKIPDFLRSK